MDRPLSLPLPFSVVITTIRSSVAGFCRVTRVVQFHVCSRDKLYNLCVIRIIQLYKCWYKWYELYTILQSVPTSVARPALFVHE